MIDHTQNLFELPEKAQLFSGYFLVTLEFDRELLKRPKPKSDQEEEDEENAPKPVELT